MRCPKIDDPQVAQEFGELMHAIGEANAYAYWDVVGGGYYSWNEKPNSSVLSRQLDLVFGRNSNNAKRLKFLLATSSKTLRHDFMRDNALTFHNGEPMLMRVVEKDGIQVYTPYTELQLKELKRDDIPFKKGVFAFAKASKVVSMPIANVGAMPTDEEYEYYFSLNPDADAIEVVVTDDKGVERP